MVHNFGEKRILKETILVPRKKCLQLHLRGGGASPILTNALLEQIRNIIKNLFLPKVLYVTKGCLKNLGRAKNALRAQNPPKSIFGATNFAPFNFLSMTFRYQTKHAGLLKIA